MNLCRACLSSNIDLFPSDNGFVYNYNLLTNLNVKPFDGKSQHFCQTCVDAVNFFIEFRNKCLYAESNLQESCCEQTSHQLSSLGALITFSGKTYAMNNEEDNSSNLVKRKRPPLLDHRENTVTIDREIVKSEKQESEIENNNIKSEIKCEDPETSFDMLYEYPTNQYSDDVDQIHNKTEEVYGIKMKKPRRQSKKQLCKRKETVALKVAVPSEGNYKKLITDKPACGLCGKTYDDAVSLNEHLEGHKTDSACMLCYNKKFEHWPQLLAHRLLHIVKGANCHMCGKKFKSPTHLEDHYWKVHCGEHNVKLSCSQCSRKYNTPYRLAKHVWAIHSQNTYICDICTKVYTNKQSLKVHIISHGNIKKYVCHLCGYSSKYAAGLAAHNIRRHTPKKCICRTCERAFADSEKMAKHVCTDKSKICPICGKSFQRGYSRHMVTHRTEKGFKCPRCPAAYRCRSALKVHLDKHDNNPTQQCEHCLRRFYSPSVLIKHRRVHTGEKPYACTKCEMRFTSNHNLKVHMKVHGEMLIVKKDVLDAV